jgi:tetratricopeptide (TPR) repeat protein
MPPLVFRDYVVLLAAPRLTQAIYMDMLTPLGFKNIQTTHVDQQAISLMKKLKPQLMVATMSLSVYTGPQLLSVARQDPETARIPFVIIGMKEDEKGGLGEHVEKDKLARFIGLPADVQQVTRTILDLLAPLVDPVMEEAYSLTDEALERYKNGDLKTAAELYRKSLDLYEENADTWLKLAAILSDLGEYDEAEVAYLQALGQNQYSFVAYLGLAELYERREDYELTVGILRQALGLAQRLKVSAKSVARINFFIGEFELRLKRLAGAEKSFSQAIEGDPQSAALREDIGDAYADKGYFAESEQHYEAAIKLDPGLAHVFNKLGIAYRRQKKYQKALELYDKARIHHPHDEHLLFNIARAHMEDVRHGKAMEFLMEALEIAPDFREARCLVANLRSQLKKTELDVWKEEPLEPFPVDENTEAWRRVYE